MSGSPLLALIRTIPYLLLTLAAMPVQAAAVALDLRLAARLPRLYHRWTMRLMGFDIVVRGMPSAQHPTLFVSNHTSYFDIPILGSLIETSFIARSDMRDWPFFGWLAKLQRSVFVDRKPQNAGDHANEVGKRLAAGDDLVLFPEGTTSDGNRLLPFKSALFAVAQQASPDRPLIIQPVSIMATSLDGIPLGRSLRPFYAWYGDMPLLGHAWEALSLGRLTVVVEFHPSFSAAGFSRKDLAQRCQAAVAAGVARAVAGRFPDDRPQSPGHDQHDQMEGDEIDAAA
jgi:1-acyl-sn-glycerol-3-phosphate acyltransferase